MKYGKTLRAEFIERKNRFTAEVLLGGVPQTVHVRNTGRLSNLLVRGAEVWLEVSDNPSRKTKYDLITVRDSFGRLFNIDSTAPNKVAREWLDRLGFDLIKPEHAYGESRIDFYMERGGERFLMEVKGCTLVRGGVGYFPDAPTERGVRHLRELARAANEGYRAAVCFVIQTDGVSAVQPNAEIQPDFASELERAKSAGVEVLYLRCHVEEDGIAAITENTSEKPEKPEKPETSGM